MSLPKQIFFLMRFRQLIFRLYISILLLNLAALVASAQELQLSSNGIPPIRKFTSDDYGAHPQNWAIIQDDRGLIYAANTEGVLEYDGENWRHLNATPVVLSFEKSTSGKIYYGAVGDFGFIEPDSTGRMELTSLKILIKEEKVGAVQAVRISGNEIYFITFHTIFIYNEATKALEVINSKDKIYPSFIFDEQLHVRLWDKGLFKLNGNELELAEQGEYFTNNDMGDVIVFGTDSVIAVGGQNGAHLYSKDTAYKVPYFDHPFFRKNGFYKSVRISNDYYALCFLRDGLVIVDKNWKPVLHLNDEVGFENQTHNAFEDKEGNLWVGTNAGISHIELTSPVSTYSELNGLKTAVYNIVEHKGEIFATGNAGVFHKPVITGFELLEKGAKSFKKIENSQNIGVELLTNQRTLFSLHTVVTGEISEHKFNQLFTNKTNMASGTFTSNPQTIVTTSDLTNKLEVFKQENQRWRHTRTLQAKNLPEDILMRMEYDRNTNKVWGCTFQGELVSFGFREDITSIEQVQRYDSSHLVPETIGNIFKLGDSVRIFSASGIYGFSESTQKFIKDERFSDYFDKVGVTYMAQQDENTFWYATRYGENGKLVFNPETDEIKVEPNLFKPFKIKNSGNIFSGEKLGVLVPSMKGMLVVDPNKSESYQFSSLPLIRKIDIISNNDSTIFNGVFFDKDSSASFVQKSIWKLLKDENALRFTYAAPYFKGGGEINYQFKLDGFDENWSSWNQKNEKEYTNIPSGTYQFKIRAQNIYGVESEIATFDFSIETPWYLTYFAYLIYVFLFFVLIWIAVKFNARRLERENEKLENTILERTEQIRYQAEKLQTLDNAKSRFFANISHELRTPLTLIQGPLESILNGSLGKVSDTIKSNLDLSRTSTKKLLNLVEEILDLSKLEAGKLELKLESIKFSDLIKRIFFTYQSSSAAKRITLELAYNLNEETIVKVDIGKLEKILDNLLSNAVKFTEQGGKIKMIVDEVGSNLQIQVTDNGIGIDKAEINQIFDRFYQAGKENKYAGGTGIGLSLANELSSLMDGHLELASELNSGTTFKLTIPLISGSSEDIITSSEEQLLSIPQIVDIDFGDPSKYKNAKILIVEDNEMMRLYIRKQMSNYYLVDEAEDGMEALEKIESNNYDLIITDLMMPRLDGYDLVSKLRENEKTKDISIIMLTARAADEDIIEGLHIGVDDYMTKPFNPQELKARVQNILTNRSSRIEIDEDEKETSADDKLIHELKKTILEHLKDSTFNVSVLADKLAISERQLNRNIKKITGLTAGNFIREVRLNESRVMLENKTYHTISEVCYAVGFEKPGYFSEIYTKRFGKRPADYLS